ncbi:MAG: carboxymuconolactone decarboxylase family protein [Planctomycetota bacterium]
MRLTTAAAVLSASSLTIGVGLGATATELFEPETTSRGFALHTPESAPEMAETFEAIEGSFGFVPNLTAVMAESPALLNAYLSTQQILGEQGALTPQESNVVQLTIAKLNGCQYCVNGHGMVGEMMLGQDPGEIKSLRKGSSLGDAKHEALRVFTESVHELRGRVTDAQLDEFYAAGYTREHALEVIANIAAKVMSNYTNQLAETPLDAPIASYRDSH